MKESFKGTITSFHRTFFIVDDNTYTPISLVKDTNRHLAQEGVIVEGEKEYHEQGRNNWRAITIRKIGGVPNVLEPTPTHFRSESGVDSTIADLDPILGMKAKSAAGELYELIPDGGTPSSVAFNRLYKRLRSSKDTVTKLGGARAFCKRFSSLIRFVDNGGPGLLYRATSKNPSAVNEHFSESSPSSTNFISSQQGHTSMTKNTTNDTVPPWKHSTASKISQQQYSSKGTLMSNKSNDSNKALLADDLSRVVTDHSIKQPFKTPDQRQTVVYSAQQEPSESTLQPQLRDMETFRAPISRPARTEQITSTPPVNLEQITPSPMSGTVQSVGYAPEYIIETSQPAVIKTSPSDPMSLKIGVFTSHDDVSSLLSILRRIQDSSNEGNPIVVQSTMSDYEFDRHRQGQLPKERFVFVTLMETISSSSSCLIAVDLLLSNHKAQKAFIKLVFTAPKPKWTFGLASLLSIPLAGEFTWSSDKLMFDIQILWEIVKGYVPNHWHQVYQDLENDGLLPSTEPLKLSTFNASNSNFVNSPAFSSQILSFGILAQVIKALNMNDVLEELGCNATPEPFTTPDTLKEEITNIVSMQVDIALQKTSGHLAFCMTKEHKVRSVAFQMNNRDAEIILAKNLQEIGTNEGVKECMAILKRNGINESFPVSSIHGIHIAPNQPVMFSDIQGQTHEVESTKVSQYAVNLIEEVIVREMCHGAESTASTKPFSKHRGLLSSHKFGSNVCSLSVKFDRNALDDSSLLVKDILQTCVEKHQRLLVCTSQAVALTEFTRSAVIQLSKSTENAVGLIDYQSMVCGSSQDPNDVGAAMCFPYSNQESLSTLCSDAILFHNRKNLIIQCGFEAAAQDILQQLEHAPISIIVICISDFVKKCDSGCMRYDSILGVELASDSSLTITSVNRNELKQAAGTRVATVRWNKEDWMFSSFRLI